MIAPMPLAASRSLPRRHRPRHIEPGPKPTAAQTHTYVQPAEQRRLLAAVESFCQELREHEELCYVEHRFNHHLIPMAQKYNILGMPVPVEYGGRGADTVTYATALARIGQEGTGVRTFF